MWLTECKTRESQLHYCRIYFRVLPYTTFVQLGYFPYLKTDKCPVLVQELEDAILIDGIQTTSAIDIQIPRARTCGGVWIPPVPRYDAKPPCCPFRRSFALTAVESYLRHQTTLVHAEFLSKLCCSVFRFGKFEYRALGCVIAINWHRNFRFPV